MDLCKVFVAELLKEDVETPITATGTSLTYPVPEDYIVYTKEKFIFRIPKNGFYFTKMVAGYNYVVTGFVLV